VVARLTGLVPSDLLDDIAVITSELATNAVYHAGSLFDVLASVGADGTARIAVSDTERDRPRVRTAQTTAPDGRGLAIVAALSDRWGVEPLGSGKTVWAELLAR
jgi:anti-sigma regulatory factor (Ser/Thr protein kinase)